MFSLPAYDIKILKSKLFLTSTTRKEKKFSA